MENTTTYTWYKLPYTKQDLLLKETPDFSFKLATSQDTIYLRLTKLNYISIIIDDVFLPIGMNEKNPYDFGDYRAFLDSTDCIWLGIVDK
jgi:hypothetical protein